MGRWASSYNMSVVWICWFSFGLYGFNHTIQRTGSGTSFDLSREVIVNRISIFLNRCRDCNHVWTWKTGYELICPECGAWYRSLSLRYEGEEQGLLLVREEKEL